MSSSATLTIQRSRLVMKTASATTGKTVRAGRFDSRIVMVAKVARVGLMCKPLSVIRLDDLPGRPCSAAAALEVVGDRWALLVVRELLLGNHRFTEIARNTGAPRDRLPGRLKELRASGVVEKRQYQDAPPRHEYHLTRAGFGLAPVLRALLAWGDRWAVDESPMRLRHHDHELVVQATCATCGERVRHQDVTREVLVEGWDEAGPVKAG